MKTRKLLIVGITSATLAVAAIGLTGCNLFGGKTPPNAIESALYKTITNYVDQIVLHTNEVFIPVVKFSTNEIGNIVSVTNIEHVTVFNYETNKIPVYDHTVSDQTKATVQTGGGFLNMFFPGAGPVASSAVLALLAAWGHFRSYRRGQTNDALSQEAETILEFIKTLPNGTSYKDAITTWMQNHQLEAGVLNQVLALLDNTVDNPQAKGAAFEIRADLNAVRSVTMPPIPPPQAPQA